VRTGSGEIRANLGSQNSPVNDIAFAPISRIFTPDSPGQSVVQRDNLIHSRSKRVHFFSDFYRNIRANLPSSGISQYALFRVFLLSSGRLRSLCCRVAVGN
jgi:hypothetical protein